MTDTTTESWSWPEARWRGAVEKVRAGRSLKPARWKNGARACVALSFDPDHETGTLREGSTSVGRLSQGQYGPLAEDVERDLMARAFDTLSKATGQAPVGVRVPSWDFSPNTLKLIREMGLLYDSSLMADDEPYELVEDGVPTGVVELPVEWIKDDAPYFNMNRFEAIRPYTPPSGVLEIFKAEFDGAVAEGGLFLLTMHPHIIGHRSRMAILEDLVQHIKTTPGVWFATHEEVARYCKEQA